MRSVLALLCCTALTAACASDRALPAPSDGGTSAPFAGTWTEEGMVVGSALVLTLSTESTMVTGRGTYAIEAGRSGIVTITGRVNGAVIHVDLAYDYGPQAQFDGSLSDQNTLKGAMHFGPPSSLTPSYVATFRRN